jgi:hypothetical protein
MMDFDGESTRTIGLSVPLAALEEFRVAFESLLENEVPHNSFSWFNRLGLDLDRGFALSMCTAVTPLPMVEGRSGRFGLSLGAETSVAPLALWAIWVEASIEAKFGLRPKEMRY